MFATASVIAYLCFFFLGNVSLLQMSTQRPSMSLHVTWPSPVLILQATTADSKMSKYSLENIITFFKETDCIRDSRMHLKSAVVMPLHLLYMQCTSTCGNSGHVCSVV